MVGESIEPIQFSFSGEHGASAVAVMNEARGTCVESKKIFFNTSSLLAGLVSVQRSKIH